MEWYLSRLIISGALVLVLSACASSDLPSPPPPAPTPAPAAVEETPEAPAPEPEVRLAERIRAPFAVESSGRPAPRERRAAVVLDTLSAPEPRRVAADEPEADTLDVVAPPAVAEERPAASEPPAAQPRTPPPAAAETEGRPAQPPTRPAAPEPAPPPPAGSPPPREHRVAAGETFMGIARRYGVSFTALLNANPGLDPDRLRPDQVLRIPAAGGAAAAPASPAPRTAPAARTPARTHTVAQGETLWSIARRYGVAPEQLRTANRLPDDTIRVGQTLVIP